MRVHLCARPLCHLGLYSFEFGPETGFGMQLAWVWFTLDKELESGILFTFA